MRFGQIRFENKITAALFEDGAARPIPGYNTVTLIRKAETEAMPLTDLIHEMASRHREPVEPAIPIRPVEVWGCGCTYERGGAPAGSPEPDNPRPEIFFKGTARVCVGPGQPIGIRVDSQFTAPEPELGVVLGSKGAILGFTLANDVSAWDIRRENPLFQPQAKIFTGSCALGPVIVTPDELPEVARLEMTCRVTRGGEERFAGAVSVGRLRRPLTYLIEYLLRANPVPAGSVMLTGTGIVVPQEAALAPGDVVTITVPEIGELSNPAVTVE